MRVPVYMLVSTVTRESGERLGQIETEDTAALRNVLPLFAPNAQDPLMFIPVFSS